MIDKNEIDVSEAGTTVLKLVAGAVKKESARIRILARTSPAAPPKELRNLFKTAGEMRTVRAARVMSALEDAGLSPADITIVGESERQPARGHHKAPAAATADRLDLEVEPG